MKAILPTAALRRDMASGTIAGLVAGLIFWWALQSQGMSATVPGLLGLSLSGGWVAPQLLVAALLGAGFGGVLRHQPGGYAATIGIGLLFGLLWWIAGPITLSPIFDGRGPTWSIGAAGPAFPSLVGHLVYGGITGLVFYAQAALYLRWRPAPEAIDQSEEAPQRRVVILGGGFGGMSAAQRLEGLFSRDSSLEVTLISQSNYLLFTPMLAEVASSALEAQHISAPVRASCPHTRFQRAQVRSINTKNRVVEVRSDSSSPPESLPYDHLLLALGSVPNYFGLPGMEDYCFTLKTLDDAMRLRNHVIGMLERADLETDPEERRRQLTFAVAGGGFAGTEAIAELFDLTHSALRYYPNIRSGDLRFVLIHPRDRILPELGAKLADYALQKLQARGIEFMLDSRVGGATADSVLLNERDPVPTHTVVWTAGNQPNPILQMLPVERNRAGAVIVDHTLQAAGMVDVWAVGDCAQIPDPDHEGQSYPPTAQHALREGKVVAENIAAALQSRPLKQFRFRALGVLVGLGHRTAAAEIGGWRFSGLLAWFLWRSIYLGKLPGLEKKVRVTLDWAIDLFFPRDIVLTATTDRSNLPRENRADAGAAPEQPGPDTAGEGSS